MPKEAVVQRQRDARTHDGWFRAEVEQGLVEADDPAIVRVAHDEVEAAWKAERAELVKRAGKRPV